MRDTLTVACSGRHVPKSVSAASCRCSETAEQEQGEEPTEEQRFIVRFLYSGGMKHTQVHGRTKVQCGDACASQHRVCIRMRFRCLQMVRGRCSSVSPTRVRHAVHAQVRAHYPTNSFPREFDTSYVSAAKLALSMGEVE